MKQITTLLLLLSLCLNSCNNQNKRPIPEQAVSVEDSIYMNSLSEQELEILNRVNHIFSDVEIFINKHRDHLDDNDPKTGKPYYEHIESSKYLSNKYLELSLLAEPWWFGPLYDHWLQNLEQGSVTHALQSIEFFEEGDSALAHLTLKGTGISYSAEQQKIIEVPQETSLTIKLVRERGGWYIDDFRTRAPCYYSEKEAFLDIIAFTPFRGDWISADGDSLKGYFLSDHEISSDLKGSKFFAYELHLDTIILKEVYYDENNAMKEKNGSQCFGILNGNGDTLVIKRALEKPQFFVRRQP